MLTRRHILLGAAQAPVLAQTRRRSPNVIILFADDMGYGDLGCYGHPTIRTPNLDRMAGEGARFTSFYAAAPVCTPSRVGLLTGRYPVRAGLPNNLGPDSKGGLPLTEILLPQVLKKNGYRTMAIGKWHLGHHPIEFLPTRRGFDAYLGLPYSNDMIPPWVKTETPLHLYRGDERIEVMSDQSNLTERYTEEAVRFVREAGDQPFFLYLPYAMPHLPVSTSERFRGRSRAGLYGDVIETIDWSAGEILRTLKERRLDNNTLVVFTSDNGPWHDLPPRMLQKGVHPWHTGTKGLLRGAKGTTYEGGPRVPCIVRWPGVVEPRTVMDMASTLDLFPTVTAAAGATMPPDRVYDGYDIGPLLRGSTSAPRNRFYYFLGARLEAIRDGSWKCRLAAKASGPELFNVDEDPAEQYNRYTDNREVADRLIGEMRRFDQEVNAAFGPAA
jgi:arylsulfatase A-like enzyme